MRIEVRIRVEQSKVGRRLDALGCGIAAKVDYFRTGVLDDPHSVVDKGLIRWWVPSVDGGPGYVLGPGKDGLIVVHSIKPHAHKIVEVIGEVTFNFE